MNIERRINPIVELRAADAEGGVTISGYAAVYNRDSVDLGGFIEQIAPGAFSESIARDDIRALVNHDPNLILGRNTAKTLTLRDDPAVGLFFELGLPDTQAGRDIGVSIKRGDVSQCSFGFETLRNGDHWEMLEDGTVRRTLLKVRLWDVSPVAFPAYPDTSVAARALADFRKQQPRRRASVLARLAIAERDGT